MRTVVSRLELLDPRSLGEALRMLRDEPGVTPLAGATDLYVALNAGTLQHQRFISLSRLAPLRRISASGGTLSIGALATFTSIIRSRLIQQRFPMLISAAREIGGMQIQNRATIGGNIANASPAGDTLPVLAAANAIIVLRSTSGARRVPITSFYTGYRASVRQADELITAVEIPTIEGVQWFRKVGTRAAQAVAKVVMAGIRGPEVKVAVGSVAPTVVRLRRTEAALAAGGSPENVEHLLQDEINPIDDLRSTAAYRRQATFNLLRRFWLETASG